MNDTREAMRTCTEVVQGILALALGAVAVNGCGREASIVEVALQMIGALLGLDEDEAQRFALCRRNQVQQVITLLMLFNPQNLQSAVGLKSTFSKAM